MPNFKKGEAELTTRLDKWLFFIKHLEDFQSIPSIFKGEVVFEQAFEKAELAKLNESESYSYESSLKVYRDLKAVIDTADMNGEMRGIAKVAKSLREAGVDLAIIVKTTGLTEEQINSL